MKITKKELNQIIKEEADRFLTIQSLEVEKARIQKELNENYSMEEDDNCEENEAVAEGHVEECAMEENEGVEENEGIEENEGVEENEGIEEDANCEEGVEEGIMDMFKKDPKKGEEAIALAKKAVEAEINKGEVIEWKGLDKLTTGKVVRKLTDEEKSDLKSRIQSFVDNVLTPKNKWDGLDVGKQDIRVVMVKGKPTLAAAYKDRKLAGVSGKFTEGNESINENDIRKIFREEARKSEEIKKLKKEANKIISEIEKIG